jgi:uncharacterized damage-inducible protein DinB
VEEQRLASESKRYAANIRQVPSLFTQAASNLPDDVLRWRPDPDEWSAVEVLGHMVDKMRIWRVRLATILSQPDAEILGYDQDALVRQNNYLAAELAILLKALSEACEQFASLVEQTEPTLLSRKGMHSELGRISGADCIEIPLRAANDHLAQLRRAVSTKHSSERRSS